MHKGGRAEIGSEGKELIDMVLAKKDMLLFVQDIRAVRGIGLTGER